MTLSLLSSSPPQTRQNPEHLIVGQGGTDCFAVSSAPINTYFSFFECRASE